LQRLLLSPLCLPLLLSSLCLPLLQFLLLQWPLLL
jgi:hypothetical protein